MEGPEGETDEEIVYRAFLQPEAAAELEEAFEYYERRSPGLGLDFLRAVDATIAFIERNPLMCAVIHKDARRNMLRRFPYGLIYIIEGNRIEIIACFHASRDPEHWQQRL